MRVTNNCNSHSQQRQQASCHDHGFADMYASMSAQRHGSCGHGKTPHHHGKPEPQKGCCHSKHPDIAELNLHMSSIHRFGCHQIKLTPEQLRPLHKPESGKGGAHTHFRPANPHRHCTTHSKLRMGRLTLVKEPCKGELIEHKPTPPTYPKSIKVMSISELRIAYTAVSLAGGGFSTEGMTKQEIYDHIKGIYEAYLGKDFLEVSHRQSSDPTGEDGRYNVYTAIFMQFHIELRSYEIHNLTSQEVMELEDYSVDALDELTKKLLSQTVPPSNPRSIYDMLLHDVRAAFDTVSIKARTGGNIGDAEGLTREEIFERLQEVYASFFGEDFLDGGVDTRGGGGLYDEIYLQFFDELKQYNVHSTSTDAILNLRSYSVQALDDTWKS